jgi:hypothetical protein
MIFQTDSVLANRKSGLPWMQLLCHDTCLYRDKNELPSLYRFTFRFVLSAYFLILHFHYRNES